MLLLVIISIAIFIATYKSLQKFRTFTVNFFIFFMIINLLVDIYMTFNQKSIHKTENIFKNDDQHLLRSNPPNIYYIILDSFTSLESLHKYWDYSDPSLELILTQNNINRAVSCQTKFQSTPYCMASFFNMNWEKADQKEEISTLYQSLNHLRYNSFVSILQHSNYQIKNFSLFKIGAEENTYSYFPEVSIWGNSLPFLVYRIVRKLNNTPYELRVNFEVAQAVIDQSKLNSLHREPVFTYAHLMLPHARYLLDSVGNLQKDNSLPDKLKYLSQLKFARKALVYFFTTIIRNDPESVIILQGDHGFRYLENPDERKKEAYTIFNAVYLSGEMLPEDTLLYLNNPINNFRIVLNKYFGAKVKLTSV